MPGFTPAKASVSAGSRMASVAVSALGRDGSATAPKMAGEVMAGPGAAARASGAAATKARAARAGRIGEVTAAPDGLRPPKLAPRRARGLSQSDDAVHWCGRGGAAG